MYLVNDRTRSLWIGTNGGHVYVYSIVGFEPQSINGPAIATDHTSACSLGKKTSSFNHWIGCFGF
jgi:hypothetical protein